MAAEKDTKKKEEKGKEADMRECRITGSKEACCGTGDKDRCKGNK